MKLCHNLFLGVVTQSMAEVTLLAEAAGVSRGDFLEFLNESVMGSTFTKYKTPAFVNLDLLDRGLHHAQHAQAFLVLGLHGGDDIGLQAGGQAYAQVIFFEDEASYNNFTGGNFELSAQASAIAAAAGVASNATYRYGVAIFTLGKSGLMYEASVGGQKFSFNPI